MTLKNKNMNITKTQVDALNAIITIAISKDDYSYEFDSKTIWKSSIA